MGPEYLSYITETFGLKSIRYQSKPKSVNRRCLIKVSAKVYAICGVYFMYDIDIVYDIVHRLEHVQYPKRR